jgi:hypothetical protein
MLDILRLICDTNYTTHNATKEQSSSSYRSTLLAKYANTIDAWMAIDQQSDRENGICFDQVISTGT